MYGKAGKSQLAIYCKFCYYSSIARREYALELKINEKQIAKVWTSFTWAL